MLRRRSATSSSERWPALVSCDEARLGLLSGLFCVPKDLERDRLILDARPPNSAEPGLSRWTKTMSSAACLSQIVLRDDESLRMSGRDIKDYFYQFTVSPERCRRNVLASYILARAIWSSSLASPLSLVATWG